MKTEPRPELFDDVAEQFERLEQPLNLGWMERRGVSLAEVQALSGKIALVLRGYAALHPQDQIAFVHGGLFRRPPTDKTAESPIGKRVPGP